MGDENIRARIEQIHAEAATKTMEATIDTIESLRASNAALAGRCKALEVALNPFIDVCDLKEPSFDGTWRPDNFEVMVSLGDLRRARSALSEEAPWPWMPIESAKKDRTPYLICLKNPIPNDREDLRRWDGLQFVARHPGIAEDGFDIGWGFAAPVGHGGFPDEWIAGCMPLPESSPAVEAAVRKALEGK